MIVLGKHLGRPINRVFGRLSVTEASLIVWSFLTRSELGASVQKLILKWEIGYDFIACLGDAHHLL
ncbi:hypothetical protein RUM4293_01228 [Ruegeria atlantica]|uniref:Uncharacterized protein n=1 Tax=Ruegeria atlantica TaxID=81569 RepID=A0A0N7LNG3_9RHOB|nr:hypothetical protein RUM4293_01228 [Ruegeria atlantica]